MRPEFGVVRVNSENLSTNLNYCFHWSDTGNFINQRLVLADSGISAENISVIWYRKPEKPTPHPALIDPAAKECSEQEYKELLRSFIGFFPRAKWVNDYWQMQKYSVKANQIWIAKQVGLSVPETVLTNDISVIRELGNRHAEIITKSIYYAGFGWGGTQYGCFTYVLSPDELNRLTSEELAYAPSMFQQRVNKVQELRVTVIEGEVIACEIQTQHHTLENIDWRIEDVEDIPHKIVDIPDDVAARLKKMLSIMGLNFGAFDLIVDETGTYYFIEVNPNGQYYWMEILTGAPLTEAMVSLILKLADSE